MKFKEKIEKNIFVKTIEITPPIGTDTQEFCKYIKKFKRKFDAINITDNQRSTLHMSSLAASKIALDLGAEVIMQITCRDRNKLALQGDIMGAYALGIKNILALTGDPINIGNYPESKSVFELSSIELIKMIKNLNIGLDAHHNRINKRCDFFIGAAINPLYEKEKHIEKKVQNGAHFFQTQIIYDIKKFKEFLHNFEHKNMHIIAGIMPLHSMKMADFINKKIAGVTVPKNLITELKKSKNPIHTGILQAQSLIEDLRHTPGCAGIHLMTASHEDIVNKIL